MPEADTLDTEAAVRRWIDAWERAWPAADPAPLADVYAEDAVFRSEPFRALQSPRHYAEWIFSEQDEADCRFGEPLVIGDRAVVEYWGVVRFEGRDETIAGVALIRFRADGRVAEQRDYWNAKPGRVEPPDGWRR
jgi:ketosteroid isomerase-like protein